MLFEAPQFLAFLNQLRPMELLIIAFIVLLLFGAKRLPDLFRSMGRSIGEFKKATREIEDEVRSAMDSGDESSSPSKSTQTESSTVEKTESDSKESPADSETEPAEKKS